MDGQRAAGGTNVYDALAAAFDDDRIDTIYLLTDGDPSAGEIVDAGTLREEVARWNSIRGIRIHCIAVGKDSPLKIDRGLNKLWGRKGSVFTERHDASFFGEQLVNYACLYTSRVSNFLFVSPNRYFRAPHGSMPHWF